MTAQSDMATGYRRGVDLVRESLRDPSTVPVELLAAEILAGYWRIVAARGDMGEASIAAIDSLAECAAERIWDALQTAGRVS